MKIGVIGVGSIGGTLARQFSALGHEVRVANSRGPEAVKTFADEIGASATDARGAIQGADAIILSIPFPAVAKLPKGLFDGVPETVPVVDTGNYYPGLRDDNIQEIDDGEVESVWVSKQLGHPVIKIFNNILAYSLAKLGSPRGTAGRLALPIAGDNATAKKTAMDIVDQLGFDPVDAGSLEESWRQQPLTPAYCCDYDAEKTRKGLARAVKDGVREKFPQVYEQVAVISNETGGDQFSISFHDKLVALNRSFSPLEQSSTIGTPKYMNFLSFCLGQISPPSLATASY